jgi:hypothetical protein
VPKRRRLGGSPLSPVLLSSPKAGPDYHSVHTLIPVRLCVRRQSRGFPRRCNRFLASFAEQVCGNPSQNEESAVHQPHSRQATLHTALTGTACRYNPSRSFTHVLGPPRRQGQRLHAIVDRPSSLTPSTSPRLGVESQHQELHRYAGDGFLGPPLKSVTPTRILRHPLLSLHVPRTGDDATGLNPGLNKMIAESMLTRR